MNRPGDLRAFAARWCCADTMARIVDPLIGILEFVERPVWPMLPKRGAAAG